MDRTWPYALLGVCDYGRVQIAVLFVRMAMDGVMRKQVPTAAEKWVRHGK